MRVRSRKEYVSCCNCNELIDVTEYVSEYWETDQEQAMAIIECEECKTKNTLYWESVVEFGAWRTTDIDIDLLGE